MWEEENKKEEGSSNGLKKLRIEDKELENQIENYNTLSFFKSCRKRASGWLFAIAILNLLVAGPWSSSMLIFILAFFVYQGHKVAIIVAMIYWTISRAIRLFNDPTSPVINILWWLVFMRDFWMAYEVEQARNKTSVKKDCIISFFVVALVLFFGQILIPELLKQPLPDNEAKETLTDWKTYRNDEYGFEIKYPYYSTNVKYDIRSAEMLLPLELGSRLFEKVFTINIIEEEYDQPIDYYCIQGKPDAFITTLNEIDFCQSVSYEEVKEDLVVIRRFTYHTIHNKKWITLSLQLSYCLPRFSGDECSASAEFNESKEQENFIQMLSTLRFIEKEVVE